MTFFSDPAPNPIMCFIIISEMVYFVISVVAVTGLVMEKRKLLLPWLVATWMQFFTLTLIMIVAVSEKSYVWLSDGIITICVVAFFYAAILSFYRKLVLRNNYNMHPECVPDRC